MNRRPRVSKEGISDADADSVYEVEYSPQQITYNDLVLMHLRRCNNAAIVEFRGGFYTTAIDKLGHEKEIYVPDTRDVFCNAVYHLCLLLRPRFSKIYEEKYQRFLDRLDNLTRDFINKTETDETVVLGEPFYENKQDKVLLEEYKQKRLRLHIKLFAYLAEHLENKGFTERKGVNLIWGGLDRLYDTEKYWEFRRQLKRLETLSKRKTDASTPSSSGNQDQENRGQCSPNAVTSTRTSSSMATSISMRRSSTKPSKNSTRAAEGR